MSGRYSVEDLLKLRASPLICKPQNLPAIEEILSAADAKTQRPSARRAADDTTTATEGFPKRPLLDQRKSTTDPDRIILGPPRRAFASSNARTGGKGAIDVTDDTQPTKDKVGFDRFKNGDTERRINGRFTKHDPDNTAEEKPRRRIDDLDGESKTRRDHDRRPKWAADDEAENDGRPDRSSRAKFEQSWLKPGRGADALEEGKRDNDRGHGWREKKNDRGWDRPGLVEDDPEWMDAPVEEEKQAPARTQEDFQRWKERMKAGKSATDTEEPTAAPSSPGFFEEKSTKTFAPILDAEPDDSMDKFFARFNETKITSEKPAATKGPTKSRFGSLFSPPPEVPQQRPAPPPQPVVERPAAPPSPPPPPPPTSVPQEANDRPPSGFPNADADQAGFARIMEMLKNRSNNPTPQDTKPRVPLYARDSPAQIEQERPQQPPGLMALFGAPHNTARSPQPATQDHVQESRPSIETHHGRQQSQKNDALLDLLRQANQAAKPTPPPPRYNSDAHLGAMNESARIREMANQSAIYRNQMISPASPPDPSVMAMLGRPENDRGPPMHEQHRMQYREEPQHRRPTNGEQPPQDQLLNFVRGFNQPQKQSQQPQAPPPGLGRPPGLDQMSRMPPGWPQQAPPPPQQQQPRQSGPPPGMTGPPRNIPAQYAAQGVPQQQRAQPSQRKYTGDFPPGMGPPPGFMGAPPGFQQGYGGPQGMSRPQFMDMYGDGRGMRGNAAGGMPGYR